MLGNIKHGRTSYDLDRQEAWYIAPMQEGRMVIPAFIQLVPGEGDTMESWFKVGGADAIADQLLSTGKTRSCIITTSKLEFMQNMPQRPGFGIKAEAASEEAVALAAEDSVEADSNIIAFLFRS